MSDERITEVVYRLKVELGIFGSNREFTEINALLGENAKHYARKGLSVEGRPVARQNVWAYWGDGPTENADIAEQWKPLDRLINRRQNEIVALGKQAKVRVAVIVHAFKGYPGMLFSPRMIAQVSALGAALDIDLYGSLTGENF